MSEPIEEKDLEKSRKKAARKLIQLERTRTAFERLQLAWVRTALTFIGIGIAIYEFFYRRAESGKIPLFESFTGRELALVFYFISQVILILSLRQHNASMAQLKASYPQSRYSVAALLSQVLLVFALFLTSLVLWRAFNP
jgi:uncharacterized membrane protein YidH (DUF202 family)